MDKPAMPLPVPGQESMGRWQLKDYLTAGVIVPVLLIVGFFSFIFFDFILPEIQDYTAFYGSPSGIVDRSPVKTIVEKPMSFYFEGTHGIYTHKRTYIITPVSNYEIEARVLHTRHYYSDKNSADLIPFDMGLGWGLMSDVKALKEYYIFHHENYGGRSLQIVFRENPREIPRDYFAEAFTGQHFSNNHLIPANQAVYDTLNRMGAGDIVKLKGQLVDIRRPDSPGWYWVTSRHDRDDANKNYEWGDGETTINLTTCDTIFVTEAEIASSH